MTANACWRHFGEIISGRTTDFITVPTVVQDDAGNLAGVVAAAGVGTCARSATTAINRVDGPLSGVAVKRCCRLHWLANGVGTRRQAGEEVVTLGISIDDHRIRVATAIALVQFNGVALHCLRFARDKVAIGRALQVDEHFA